MNAKTLGIATSIAMTLLIPHHNAMAQKTQSSVSAQLVLSSSCMIDASAVNMDFGTYSVGVANQLQLDAGSLKVTCSSGVPYRWGADGGVNWGKTSWTDKRHLTNSTKYLPYDIQLKSSGADVGDKSLNSIDATYTPTATCGTCNSVSATGTGSAQSYPLQANLYINTGPQAVYPAGTYTDTVIFTVVWP